MSQNNKTTAMLVFQTNLVGVALFSGANAFFCFNKFAGHVILLLLTPAQHKENFVVLFVAENAHDFVVNVDSFSQHPTKRCTQKVVCCYGNYSTSKLKEKEMKKSY